MREVKYRLWCKERQEMIDIRKMYFEDGKLTTISCVDHDSDFEYFTEDNDHVLMQYTGLKDVNGKEIYEGDILRVWRDDEYIPNRDSGGGIVDYDCESGFSQIGKVGFEGCSFDYSTIKTLNGRHEDIHLPIDWLDNYEVIGNVFGNAEILEDK